MKKLLFIFNPKSGKGLIKSKLFDIIDVFVKGGYDVTVYPTQRQGDATVKTREHGGNYDVIVCSGGDGTLDEVVSGLTELDKRIPLGYIPSGSTNDFANSLDIPTNMMKAAQNIVDGELFSCDIGTFNHSTFIYVAAFGMFTDVSYLTDQGLKNALGHVAYLLEGSKRLLNIPAIHATVHAGKDTFDGDFMYGMVTNAKSIGGIRNITGSEVEMDDGLFEVCLVQVPKNPLELNEIITGLVLHEERPNLLHFYQTDAIDFLFDEATAWTLDGEYGGTVSEVHIAARRHAVKLIVNNQD